MIIGYLRTDIFCKRNKPSGQAKLTIRIPAHLPKSEQASKLPMALIAAKTLILIPEKLYQRVAMYLWSMMRSEKDSESKLHAKLSSISWKQVKNDFTTQLRGYFQGILPYDPRNGESPLNWWCNHQTDSRWYILAVSRTVLNQSSS